MAHLGFFLAGFFRQIPVAGSADSAASYREASRSGYRSASLMLGVGIGGALIDAAAAWECQIIHTQSHRSIREIVCA